MPHPRLGWPEDQTVDHDADGTSEFPLSSPPPGPLVAYCSDGREVASVDDNRIVNAADLGLVASVFGGYTAPPAPGTEWKMNMDFDKNGTVNSADLGLVAAKFGACP